MEMIKTCKICGEFITRNKNYTYCDSCLRKKGKDIKLRYYYRNKMVDEDKDNKIKFFKSALTNNRESYKTRKKIFTEELKKLGCDVELEQGRL